MTKNSLHTLVLLLCALYTAAQVQSPEQFLGYPLGNRFTPHHRIVAYFEHVASQQSTTVVLKKYGETNELRPLMVAFISSGQHISKLEEIRTDNLKRTGIMEGAAAGSIPITWLSYNVHGNEAVSSEAAMQTLWELVNPQNEKTKEWLDKTLVVIDPCLNPDGRDRYANWYNQKMNSLMQPDPQSTEHREPWPGGRANHYLFDLNRDWAWQTQKESQARLKLYNEWLPQVHVDFHEQGIDQPYYFAPAAEPLHKLLTPFQHAFQDTVGRNNARYFDQHNWLYFTKERFDMLYPSYGDSYPMFNGSIGMTYEQGGSGAAGIGVLNALKDTLTLKDRIAHHYTSGLSTVETVAKHADKLLEEFAKYFQENSKQPRGTYKSFVIKAGQSPERLSGLLKLLDKNNIRYGKAASQSGLKGFNYQSGKERTFSVSDSDIVVSAYQPKSTLAQALFEPHPILTDSITYDITSWALPYAYGLEAYALTRRLDPAEDYREPTPIANSDTAPMAYLAPWHATNHVQFLAALLREGIRVRYAANPFTLGQQQYSAGTLIILQAGNEQKKDFHKQVVQLANQYQVELQTTQTAYVDHGKDFGSPDVKAIKAPKVALISGETVSSLNFGELWHFFEQELKYPLSVLSNDFVKTADLSRYNLLILPSGNYTALGEEVLKKLNEWVGQGGKLIAIENALDFFADQRGFELSTTFTGKEKASKEKADSLIVERERLAPYQQRERLAISSGISGAVFEVKIDQTHPLGYGLGNTYYSLKNHAKHYTYLKRGINVGVIPSMDSHRTGYVGDKAKISMQSTLNFGVEEIGKGQVIYLADNPLFRSFWEHGKLLMGNALFMVGQ